MQCLGRAAHLGRGTWETRPDTAYPGHRHTAVTEAGEVLEAALCSGRWKVLGWGSADGPRASCPCFHRALCYAPQGVVEFSLCLLFAKLVSYTFLYWLPLYIFNVGEYPGKKR